MGESSSNSDHQTGEAASEPPVAEPHQVQEAHVGPEEVPVDPPLDDAEVAAVDNQQQNQYNVITQVTSPLRHEESSLTEGVDPPLVDFSHIGNTNTGGENPSSAPGIEEANQEKATIKEGESPSSPRAIKEGDPSSPRAIKEGENKVPSTQKNASSDAALPNNTDPTIKSSADKSTNNSALST